MSFVKKTHKNALLIISFLAIFGKKEFWKISGEQGWKPVTSERSDVFYGKRKTRKARQKHQNEFCRNQWSYADA